MALSFQPTTNAAIAPPTTPQVAPQASPIEATTFWPEPPQTLEETGLIVPLVEDHVIRLLYFSQHATGSELATKCGDLSTKPVIL